MIDFIQNLPLFQFIRYAFFFVVALGLLVTVHEYGHFIIARLNGVRVLRFSIGFGKTLVTWHDKHGTEFAISAIPLGGYVKMHGHGGDEAEQNDPDSFANKTIPQKMAIIVAGPAANFIFAIFAGWLMYMMGISALKPVIGSVDEGSRAFEAGITAERRIVSVNGQTTRDWNDVNMAFAGTLSHEQVVIETADINSDGGVKRHVIQVAGVERDLEKEPVFKSLGINQYRPGITPEVGRVTDNSAASKAGVKVGDVIMSIDGQPWHNWQDFVRLIQDSADKPLAFVVERDGQTMNLLVTPKGQKDENGFIRGYVGIAPIAEPWPEGYLFTLHYGPLEAFYQGAEKTWQVTKLSFVLIGNLFTGHLSLSNLSGPVSIAKGAGDYAAGGLALFLSFLIFDKCQSWCD